MKFPWCHHAFPNIKHIISTLACPNGITMQISWCHRAFPYLKTAYQHFSMVERDTEKILHLMIQA